MQNYHKGEEIKKVVAFEVKEIILLNQVSIEEIYLYLIELKKRKEKLEILKV
ncbi:MAG: hypothetical protein R2879_10200 [Saprospiraceae bacterium]